MLNTRLLLLAVCVAAFACTSTDKASETADSAIHAQTAGYGAPNVVTVVATDFAFDAPAEIPAGLTTFRMENRGQTIHHVQLIKLDDGKTVQDLQAVLKSAGPPPPWMHEVGGPNGSAPTAQSNATQQVEPGNYALICFVDTPDHKPHFTKGMIRALTVVPSSTPPAREPNADVTMTLDDYSFLLSKPLTPGKHTIKVVNTASQPHEIQIIQLAPGKSQADIQSWIKNMQGPPPAKAIGGVAGFESGTTAYFDVDLPAGDYIYICFIPDSKDGKPHFEHGMIQQVRIG